jgi:hypothetical protein
MPRKQRKPQKNPNPWNRGKGAGIAFLRSLLTYQGDDCVPWPLSKDGRVGRGRIGWNGKQYWAHRLMCILAHGEPPTPKHQAAHECGKGHYGCVNPRHLSWKTNSENQLDRAKNGNALRSRTGPSSALTQHQIDTIRSLKGRKTQMEIARMFGVSLGCVQYWLKYRETRGHHIPKIRVFTKAEDLHIRRRSAEGATLDTLANELGRTTGSVRARADRIGVRVFGRRAA